MKTFDELFAELTEKAATRPAGSGTVAALDAGVHAQGKKVLEEAGEVWLAAEHEPDDALAEEISQLLYRIQVLMIGRGHHARGRLQVPVDHACTARIRSRTALCGPAAAGTTEESSMLRIALPNKGTLAEPAATMMREAGYRQRSDTRDLSMLDEENEIEFFYLRPKDIATYVGSGDLHLGHHRRRPDGRVRQPGQSVHRARVRRVEVPLRRAGDLDGADWKLEDLEGKKIATSYPRLVRAHLARNRVRADIIKLDGAVEISVQLGLADAIADVVSSGRTLRQHGLVAFGDPIAESEATLIEREPRPDREETVEIKAAKLVFTERLRGVVYARQYLMIDYDCPKDVLEEAKRSPPACRRPRSSPLAEEGWFAVRIDGAASSPPTRSWTSSPRSAPGPS